MKNYFLINPAAGRGGRRSRLESDILACCAGTGTVCEIYYTTGIGDAEKYVRHTAMLEQGECRFFACGGDGTLSEVINGAKGLNNASVGVIPIGTGNDFVRNFTEPSRFFDIGAQVSGSIQNLDLIKYNSRYAADTLNIGFDAEVVGTVAKIKRNPAIPGKLAYMIGALYQLIRKPGVRMRVSVDGGEPRERDLLLCCVGNSAYCGGGFNSGPHAELTDGILDVCFVRNVSRAKFISLLGAYKAGTFLSRKGINEIVDYVKCRSLKIELPHPRLASIDGELIEFDCFDISAEHDSLRFCVPQGSALKRDSRRAEQPAEACQIC